MTYIGEQTGEEFIGKRSEDNFRYGISVMHGRTAARIISYELWHDCSMHDNFSLNKFKMRFQGMDQTLLGANKMTSWAYRR
jgi:hypothetical protein